MPIARGESIPSGMQTTSAIPRHRRWLLIDISFAPDLVRWIDFGDEWCSEPFFEQTIQRLKTATPPHPEQVTTTQTLVDLAAQAPSRLPAGVIFHVSRCGSTLLTNVLRTGAQVWILSEATPLGRLFFQEAMDRIGGPASGREEARKSVLNSFVSLHAESSAGDPRRVVIKCHALNIMDIQFVRSLWPTVPFIVVIRDPIEVIASNLDGPAGWVDVGRRSVLAAQRFGWTDRIDPETTIQECCARGLGSFYAMAESAIGGDCKIIDYSQLTFTNIRKIADGFGIDMPKSETPQVVSAFAKYAKDPTGATRFESDVLKKRSTCSGDVLALAERWALAPYCRLRNLSVW